MDPLLLAAAATFGAVFLGGAAVASLALERRQVHRTLRTLPTAELQPEDLRERTLAIPVVERLVQPTVRRFLDTVRRMTPIAQLERFREKLVRAGQPVGWDPSRLAAIRLLGRVIAPVLTFVLFVGLGASPLRASAVALLAGLMFHLGPDVLLDGMIKRRQDLVQTALPDTIDLLTITVEAGLGFDAALERVARTTDGPLGEELYRTVQEVQLGRPRAEALRGLADRTDLPDIRTLVSALVQAEQFGITIGTVLRTQAGVIREQRRQRAEEHAQKIPIKVLFPLIFCILPTLFIVLMGPGAIQLAEQFGR